MDSLTEFFQATPVEETPSQTASLAQRLHPFILNRLHKYLQDEFPNVKEYSLKLEIYDIK